MSHEVRLLCGFFVSFVAAFQSFSFTESGRSARISSYSMKSTREYLSAGGGAAGGANNQLILVATCQITGLCTSQSPTRHEMLCQNTWNSSQKGHNSRAMLKPKEFEQKWLGWSSTFVTVTKHPHDRRLDGGVRRQPCNHCLADWQDRAGCFVQRWRTLLESMTSSSPVVGNSVLTYDGGETIVMDFGTKHKFNFTAYQKPN